MKSPAVGVLPFGQYGASIALASIPVCVHESSSGLNHLEYAIHRLNSRESIASICSNVIRRWPARRILKCSVGRAFIPPLVS
jgi:hypothetical protein